MPKQDIPLLRGESRHKGLPVCTEHEDDEDDDGRGGKQPALVLNPELQQPYGPSAVAPVARPTVPLGYLALALDRGALRRAARVAPTCHGHTNPHRQALTTRHIRALPFPEKCSRLSTDLSRPGCHSALLQRRTSKSTSLEKVFQRTQRNSPASDVSVCLE